MSSEDPALVQESASVPASGTLEQSEDRPGASSSDIALSNAEGVPEGASEEEALESHEVIELQTFIERKVWIDEKIALLEKMPPIEVFAGMDAVRSSEPVVPGLVTRAELLDWLAEHDRVEKETEIFDSGELKKLRKFTKAATQRHLSPEDTDLIELTLNTIYALDKLLHLLRDRSENLDLLGVRLTWEEQRASAWKDLRAVLHDIRAFLSTRARWSPSAYERPPSDDIVARRGSVGSFASDSSSSSHPAFSRGARFKLAELLSKDAAQFANRISSLRHGKISAAGKALDKLIDNSRKPVPEELLDEQDKLEEKGINELDNVGKFIMNVVMQWRKADENYVETMKDQVSAQNLLEEIEIAKLHHPTFRQSTNFMSRTEALMKRLSTRANATSSTSNFPRPTHPLFPEQQTVNVTILQTLSTEIATASELASKASVIAREYKDAYDVVKEIEGLSQRAGELEEIFTSVTHRLENGVVADDGDGSPPDLLSSTCLQPTSHSAFLALLPSIMKDLVDAQTSCESLLRHFHARILQLDRPGIEQPFKQAAIAQMGSLNTAQLNARQVAEDVNARVGRLRIAKKMWAMLDAVAQELQDIQKTVAHAISSQRWMRGTDSPSGSNGSSPSSTAKIFDRLTSARKTLSQNVGEPLANISEILEQPVNDLLTRCLQGSMHTVDYAERMTRRLESVIQQRAAMTSIQVQYHVLKTQVEELSIRYDAVFQGVLEDKISNEEVTTEQERLDIEVSALRQVIQSFTDSMVSCILFVGEGDRSSLAIPLKRRLSSSNIVSEKFEPSVLELPFSFSSLDDDVRADSNSYVLSLSGDDENLQQKAEHLRLAIIAKEFDIGLSSSIREQRVVDEELLSLKALFSSLSEKDPTVADLQFLCRSLEEYQQKHSDLANSLTPVREILGRMESMSVSPNSTVHDALILPRRLALSDAESGIFAWNDTTNSFKKSLLAVVHKIEEAEEQRLREQEALIEAQKRVEIEAQLEVERRKEEALQIAEEQERLRELEEHEKERISVIEQLEHERRESDMRIEEIMPLANPSRSIEPTALKIVDVDEDVFGLRVTPSSSNATTVEAINVESNILKQIVFLRKRLRSISINEISRPSMKSASSGHLPSEQQFQKINASFVSVMEEASNLPSSVSDPAMDTELRSLRAELSASEDMMKRIRQLVDLATAVQSCDSALSDLLEHIDSYPSPPMGSLSSSYVSPRLLPPEEQLAHRLSFTRRAVGDLSQKLAPIRDDPRAEAESTRVLQTWSELEEMGNDRINGKKSRPASVVSSGRNSSASVASNHSSHILHTRKQSRYSNLSVKPSTRGGLLTPGHPSASRRVVSGSSDLPSRSASKMSMVSTGTTRSVSGPMVSSKLYSSTFASRQRTSSMSSNVASGTPPALRSSASRPRAQTGQSKARASPTPSDVSYQSKLTRSQSRSSTSVSTWARAPRQSFPTVLRTPPRKPQTLQKRTYVANPKNKLDVAVGDVVNKLPVNINVEVVADTWKDQSGKYWIGDQEPKLCFCRILRSQTVMVRVGGGWTELSKFIKDHFADLFRIMPPSSPTRFDSPRFGSREEKWISSATLLEAPEIVTTPPLSPRTPEPRAPYIPSFSLSPPSAHSKKSSPSGSPLAPLQFMRRADHDAANLRPATPSKSSSHRTLSSVPSTPARSLVWRP